MRMAAYGRIRVADRMSTNAAGRTQLERIRNAAAARHATMGQRKTLFEAHQQENDVASMRGKTARMFGFMIAACASLPAVAASATAACRFQAPADLDAAPARWLGGCRDGVADGLGVVRAGTAEPYAFFAGRMQGGQPAQGVLLLHAGGLMVAVGFDPALRAVSSDGLRPEEDDLVFAQARAAALDTAARLRREGNLGSADYYAALAQRIVDSRAE